MALIIGCAALTLSVVSLGFAVWNLRVGRRRLRDAMLKLEGEQK